MKEIKKNRLWQFNYRRALLATFFLKALPYIRLVGLNGSMIRGEFKRDSDIDFLIITAPNRIFTSRLLAILVVTLLGLKRSDTKVASRICLNRFATTKQLEITPRNFYHAWTFSSLMPLYADGNTYQNYCQKNLWMQEFGYEVKNKQIVLSNNFISLFLKNLGEKILNTSFGDKIEDYVSLKQKNRIELKLKISQKDWNVKVSPDELCFHLKSNSQKI